MLTLLAMRLEANGYRTEQAVNGAQARARVARGALDAVVLDLRLPDANGLELLSEFRQRAPDLPVIMLTAHGTIDSAVEAMRRGAFGFLTKPFNHHELLQRVRHAIENASLRREVADFRRIVGEEIDGSILGTSRAIATVRELIARVAPTDVTVLVTGESGTGKELAARSIHQLSARAKMPFVAVNCGAIPSELLESELFGHVRGAFTGASRDRDGLFAAARGGTLFLDEVGDAPLHVQVKLLRVLQERRYTPVGSTTEREADVRVLAATHRDLRADVVRGRFREDLFFRLHVVPLEMPPLRERREDIVLLAEVFLERASARHKLPVPALSSDALDWLLQWSWPGNVRELANLMEAATVLASGADLRSESLMRLAGAAASKPAPSATTSAPIDEREPPSIDGDSDASVDPVRVLTDQARPLPSLKDARDAFERAYLVEVLRRANGNVTAAARVAGRNRTDFYDLLRRHGVRWREGGG
ncbi:MAG: sigma-54-dependent Fis family transcriptional regulator [Myxococcales bacterium]|nr:sigma-54-dependent Fis family transcriptional regulator [Myxococcales bacterium]